MREAIRAVAEIDDGDARGALVIIGLLRDTLRAEGNTAPQWRDLNNANILFMLHVGLMHLGNQTPDLNMVTVPFTFNLTPTLLAKAAVNTQRAFASYLLKRITEALKRTLGRSVDLFFVVEIAGLGPTGRPHLHGEVLLTGDEVISERRKKGIKPVRQAFHSLNSYTAGLDNNITEDKKESFKNRAIKFEWSRCDLGWPDYIAKHLSISSLYYNGKTIAKTQGCTRSARELQHHLMIG